MEEQAAPEATEVAVGMAKTTQELAGLEASAAPEGLAVTEEERGEALRSASC